MSISRSAYFKYKKEERPVVSLLEKYFSQDELEEFLETGRIKKYDMLNALSETELKDKSDSKDSLLLLEDYANYSLEEKLKELFHIFGIPDVTKYFPKKIFIKILLELHKEEHLTNKNTKEMLIERLKGYKTSLIKLEHRNHPQVIIEFIEKKLSKVETYILVRDAKKYLENVL